LGQGGFAGVVPAALLMAIGGFAAIRGLDNGEKGSILSIYGI